jgi:hypothetical protein
MRDMENLEGTWSNHRKLEGCRAVEGAIDMNVGVYASIDLVDIRVIFTVWMPPMVWREWLFDSEWRAMPSVPS